MRAKIFFLAGEFFASDIDGFKPFQFLFFCSFALVNEQFIVKNPVLLLGGEVVKELCTVPEIESETTCYVLAN